MSTDWFSIRGARKAAMHDEIEALDADQLALVHGADDAHDTGTVQFRFLACVVTRFIQAEATRTSRSRRGAHFVQKESAWAADFSWNRVRPRYLCCHEALHISLAQNARLSAYQIAARATTPIKPSNHRDGGNPHEVTLGVLWFSVWLVRHGQG